MAHRLSRSKATSRAALGARVVRRAAARFAPAGRDGAARRASPARGLALGLAAATALAGAAPARAQPAPTPEVAALEVSSRIEAVTVHPDGAAVTRAGAVALPAGAATVRFVNLPPALDPASVRLEGTAGAALGIGSVTVARAPGRPDAAPDPAFERRVEELRAQVEIARAKLQASEGRRAAVERFAQAGPERTGENGRPLPVSEWPAAWDAIGQGLEATLLDIRARRAELAQAEGALAAQERARPGRAPAGEPVSVVTVALEAAAATEAKLTLTYRVSGAGWRPHYDARLDTGGTKPALTLARRAEIRQSTGEDWRDVSLSVSTVRARRGTAAPEVRAVVATLAEPVVIFEGRSRAYEAPRRSAPATAAPSADALAAPPAPIAAAPAQATLEASAFQASFRVPGRVTVLRDNQPQSFVLSERRVEPELGVRIAPALDETAYLEAGFVNEEEAALLAGEVSLHRDGGFVGRGRLAQTATGERVALGFGADDRVTVTRAPVRRREGDAGLLGANRTDLRDVRTTVRNGHGFPLRIAVLEAVPVSENSAVTVETLPQTTPPTERNVSLPGGGDARGVLGWTYEYKPGETREIRLAVRLRWPADRELVVTGEGAGPRPAGR